MVRKSGDPTETTLGDVVRAIQALGAGQVQTNEALAQTNEALAQTNEALAQTNSRLAQANARLDQTNARLDQTNDRLTLGFATLGGRQDETNRRLDELTKELRVTNKTVATIAQRQVQHDDRIRKLEVKSGKGRNGHR